MSTPWYSKDSGTNLRTLEHFRARTSEQRHIHDVNYQVAEDYLTGLVTSRKTCSIPKSIQLLQQAIPTSLANMKFFTALTVRHSPNR